MSSSELEKRPAHTVDVHDEPSAEWGWHGGFPKATKVAGWLTTIAMLAMLIGNHRGHTEDIWLIATAVVIASALIYQQIRSRTSWRR